jgi:hypothetical protein
MSWFEQVRDEHEKRAKLGPLEGSPKGEKSTRLRPVSLARCPAVDNSSIDSRGFIAPGSISFAGFDAIDRQNDRRVLEGTEGGAVRGDPCVDVRRCADEAEFKRYPAEYEGRHQFGPGPVQRYHDATLNT